MVFCGITSGTRAAFAGICFALTIAGSMCLVGCGQADAGAREALGTNPITAESLEGLILEGEGPIPARLIYRSRNTISSEEDRLVFDAIAQELDRLVEMAGQLDDAIADEPLLIE